MNNFSFPIEVKTPYSISRFIQIWKNQKRARDTIGKPQRIILKATENHRTADGKPQAKPRKNWETITKTLGNDWKLQENRMGIRAPTDEEVWSRRSEISYMPRRPQSAEALVASMVAKD